MYILMNRAAELANNQSFIELNGILSINPRGIVRTSRTIMNV